MIYFCIDMVVLYLYGWTDWLVSKYYPTNTFHGFPLALGTCACACFWPLLLVLLAHTGTQNHHHQKKQRCRYFCAPHTNIILPDASPPSFLHLSPPSPLSFPSLSPHTRANSHPRCQRQATKGLFFFIFLPPLLEILLGFSSQ
jgi:hypothetical protein